MKAEKSFNNPATLTVEATVRRDHNQVMITLKDTKSIRIFKVFMTKAEAKELGLDLYKISDGGDIEEPLPPYKDYIGYRPPVEHYCGKCGLLNGKAILCVDPTCMYYEERKQETELFGSVDTDYLAEISEN